MSINMKLKQEILPEVCSLSPHFGSSTERMSMRNSGIVNDCGKKLQVGDYNTLQGEDEEPWTAEK